MNYKEKLKGCLLNIAREQKKSKLTNKYIWCQLKGTNEQIMERYCRSHSLERILKT